MGIKDSEKCEFCGDKDHVEHYFFECKRNKDLWKDVSQIITNKINKSISINEVYVINTY